MPIVKERMIIRGLLAGDDFAEWIIHRARRLGLLGGIVQIGRECVETLVAGPVELVDAMEIGCSLGPISVQVDSIERVPCNFEIIDKPFAYIAGR